MYAFVPRITTVRVTAGRGGRSPDMLTRILLLDAELSRLSVDERLALEYVVRSSLSDIARDRRSGDSALLFAIAAAEVYDVLLHGRDDEAVESLVERVRRSRAGRAAVDRAHRVASMTSAA